MLMQPTGTGASTAKDMESGSSQTQLREQPVRTTWPPLRLCVPRGPASLWPQVLRPCLPAPSARRGAQPPSPSCLKQGLEILAAHSGMETELGGTHFKTASSFLGNLMFDTYLSHSLFYS